ncbi:MAG: hypothetical protein LBP39_03910 [Rickettsiales bacterium]|jgi:predicted outer membrane repeat protein|nr:hypothetical protein [Rickettsiales bacterium]
MEIDKKVNYSKISALFSYVFLNTIVIFIGLGACLCLADTANVNDFNSLKEAVGSNNISTINIKADSITLDRKLPVIKHDLAIYGAASRSTLDGNNAHRILEFAPNSGNITIDTIYFKNGHNKDPKDRDNGGGAAHIEEGTNMTFNNTVFSNNTAESCGGAIYFEGNTKSKNILIFNGKTTFASNIASGDGGAILAAYSDLIFAGEAKFENNISSSAGGAIFLYSVDGTGSMAIFNGTTDFSGNSSTNAGGAINSQGDAESKNILIFKGKTTFTDNTSTECDGGAIAAWYSDLVFGEYATFKNNSSYDGAGAILIVGDQENAANATFNKLATFEKNSSKIGGAICLQINVNMKFESGLKLINNITEGSEEEQSGAIHMRGDNNSSKVKVTIVQKDSKYLTEFRGNKSGDNGRNAFYLEAYAELNFTAENGNIDLYDVISGDIKGNSNTVTIAGKGGWFNVREKGSIDSVNLINEGNLNLASAEPSELKPKNFTNSGAVRFAIFANGRSDKITAETITLNEGTILKLVAVRGKYKEGITYDILVSESAIVGTENINLMPRGDNNIPDIQGKFINDNKVYRIVVVRDATVENDPDSFAEEIEEKEERNINNINTSTTTDQSPNYAKTLAEFISDVVTLTLLDSNFRPVVHAREGIYLESSYRNIKLANLENDGGMTITLGFGKSFKALNLGIYLSINNTSLSDKEENKADILAGTLAMVGEAAILENTLPLNLLFNLAYSRNSYTLDRNIEKIDNKTISSKFSSNVFSLAVDLEKKFNLNNIIILKPSLGLHSSLLTMSPFQKNGEDYLTLHLETQQLASINLGLGITANLPHKLTPHLSIAGLFPVSASTPEITASLKDYPDNKFIARGNSYKNPSLSLNLGLEYKLSVKLLLSTNLNYITNSSYKLFGLGLGLGMKI